MGNWPNRLRGYFGNALQKILCSSDLSTGTTGLSDVLCRNHEVSSASFDLADRPLVQSEFQSNHSEQDTEVQYRVCREGIARVFVQDLFTEIPRGLYDTSIYIWR